MQWLWRHCYQAALAVWEPRSWFKWQTITWSTEPMYIHSFIMTNGILWRWSIYIYIYVAQLPQWRILYSSQQVWRNWLHGKAQLDFGWNHPWVESRSPRLATWFERNKRDNAEEQLEWLLLENTVNFHDNFSIGCFYWIWSFRLAKRSKWLNQSLSRRLWVWSCKGIDFF